MKKDSNTAQHWLSKARNSPDERISKAALKGINHKESQLSDAQVIGGFLVGIAILGAIFGDDSSSSSSDDSADSSSDSYDYYEYQPTESWQPAPSDWIID